MSLIGEAKAFYTSMILEYIIEGKSDSEIISLLENDSWASEALNSFESDPDSFHCQVERSKLTQEKKSQAIDSQNLNTAINEMNELIDETNDLLDSL